MSTLNRRTLPTVLAAMSARALVQDTAPVNPNVGAIWFDTTDGALKVWDGATWNVAQIDSAGIADGAVGLPEISFALGDLGGSKVTISSSAPSSPAADDLWFDASNGYVMRQWNGSAWVPFQWDNGSLAPGSIDTSKVTFSARDLDGITTTFSGSAPGSPVTGDLWYDSANGYKLNRWDGAAWVAVQFGTDAIEDGSISTAKVSFTARALGANIVTFASSAPGGAIAGDLWYDTSNDYKLNEYNGTSWTAFQFGTNAIAAGAVTASLIAAHTVTAAQIAAGTITATELAASSVTADKVTVGGRGQGLLLNPSFEDADASSAAIPAAWTVSGVGTYTAQRLVDTRATQGSAMLQLTVGTPAGSSGAVGSSAAIPCSPNTNYNVRVAYGGSANVASGVYFRVAWLKSDGSAASTAYVDTVSNGPLTLTTTNSLVSDSIVTSPADAAYAVAYAYNWLPPAVGTLYVDSFDITPAVTGALIVDGTVTATEIAANTITAAQIAANTITAAEIAAGAITASELAANSVTAAAIQAGTITATELAAGIVYAGIVDATTITGAQFVATGTNGEILVYDGTPAAGNLVASVSGHNSLDAFGNHYQAGINVYRSSTGTGALNLWSSSTAGGPSGSLLSDSSGNIGLTTGSGGGDMSIFGANVDIGADTGGQVNINSPCNLVPAGSIMMFGGAAAPSGWLLCDGSSVLRSTYPDLFTAIGTTYGSVDGTHFTLPNFGSKFPRGNTPGVGGGSDTHHHTLSDAGQAQVNAPATNTVSLRRVAATSWDGNKQITGTAQTPSTGEAFGAALTGQTDDGNGVPAYTGVKFIIKT